MAETMERRIALIDDEPHILEGFRIILRRHNKDWRTFPFVEVDQALAAHGEEPFETILSDMSMPGKTGMDLLRILGEDPSLRQVPVIMVTGSNASKTKKEALERGARDFLTKPVDPSDLVARVSGALRSADQQREILEKNALLEEQVLSMKRIEMAGLLAAGSTHDLKNIICTVLSLIELSRIDPEEVWNNLKQMEKSIGLAMELNQQILDLARRKKASAIPSCNPSRIILDSVSLMRGTISVGIEIETDCPEDLPSVPVDPTELLQVVMNLVLNAAHAITGRGKIKISTVCEAEQGEPTVRITVADTGSGMSPEILASIFEPLFTTKEKGLGTGLGLNVVQRVVESYEGSIEVESALGQGTIFHIFLPLETAILQAAQ